MDSYDRHLVQFVVTWAPFGGPIDEDTYPRFGLRGRRMWNRFHRIVASAESVLAELEDDDADLIRQARALIASHRLDEAKQRDQRNGGGHAVRPTPHHRAVHEPATPR
jgi:hypothetical protein